MDVLRSISLTRLAPKPVPGVRQYRPIIWALNIGQNGKGRSIRSPHVKNRDTGPQARFRKGAEL